ncbi:hypothetical protein KSD_27820 [Ktedonobacter sp. SOSP1-85]|nr:hypothetical protein KSD_27820 [Ktedonobacter sp. SOSP1-85]
MRSLIVIIFVSEHPEREVLGTLVALRPRMGVGFRNKIYGMDGIRVTCFVCDLLPIRKPGA